MTDHAADAEIATWHRFFAVECNNRAWALADQRTRTAAESDELLNAAHAAALHWQHVGTAVNVERARMLLAHAEALAGHGARALRLARAVLDDCSRRDTPDWELAFAHAVIANAAAAAGDVQRHRNHYAEAERLGEAIADPEDRRIFGTSFASVPPPPATGTPLFGDLANVRVFAADLAESVRFYRDVLELPLRFEGPGVAVFATGTATLMLEPAGVDEDEADGPLAGRFLGVTLTAPDIATTFRTLLARGVEFLHPPEPQSWGGIMTHFRDPSGNVLTAVQYTDAA
jgi:catechol 2,3-dioxygenase-like lactoylglutathione lyase family enzyme